MRIQGGDCEMQQNYVASLPISDFYMSRFWPFRVLVEGESDIGRTVVNNTWVSKYRINDKDSLRK